jgi:hypothetical protein
MMKFNVKEIDYSLSKSQSPSYFEDNSKFHIIDFDSINLKIELANSYQRLDIGSKNTICSEEYAKEHEDEIGYQKGKIKKVDLLFLKLRICENLECKGIGELSYNLDGSGKASVHMYINLTKEEFYLLHNGLGWNKKIKSVNLNFTGWDLNKNLKYKDENYNHLIWDLRDKVGSDNKLIIQSYSLEIVDCNVFKTESLENEVLKPEDLSIFENEEYKNLKNAYLTNSIAYVKFMFELRRYAWLVIVILVFIAIKLI